MHHRDKVDAPSGTALLLGQSAAKGRGSTLQELSRFDRISEHPHARERGSIGYASLRGGSVAGEHVVILATEGERIELGHRAESRMIFARGALAAARFLIGKPAGLYSMRDVIVSLSTRAEVFEFFRRLAEANPPPTTELESGNAYQLLVAVVLSAQATDASVNIATRPLFARVKTPK